MNTLRMDRMSLAQAIPVSQMTGMDFLDVVGSKVQSSYRLALQHDTVTDITSIDIAGQTIGSADNRSMNINIKAGEYLLNTHKSYVAFEFVGTNCYPPSADALLECMNMRIGNIEVPISNGRFYQHQWRTTLGRDVLEAQKYGLGIMTSLTQAAHINGSSVLFADAGNPTFDVNGYDNLSRQLYQHFRTHTIGASGATDTTIFCVPLYMLAPPLLDLPILYLGKGQDLSISSRFLPAADCCMHRPDKANGDAMSYQIKNAMLLTVKSVLDAPRIAAIQSNSVGPMPIVKNISFKTPAVTSLSREFSIPKGHFVRRVLLSLNPKAGGSADVNTATIANLVGDALGKLKSPCNTSLPIPFSFLELKFGSQSMTIRGQQLKHLIHSSGDSDYLYDHPLLRKTRHVNSIDLSRWGEAYDASGSTGIQGDTLTVTFEVDYNSVVLPGQAAAIAPTGFDLVVNVEVVSFIACQNSIYTVL